MKEFIFFDLDGTLTDSKEGIFNSLKISLSLFNIEKTDEQMMEFIGPPLEESFLKIMNFEKFDFQKIRFLEKLIFGKIQVLRQKKQFRHFINIMKKKDFLKIVYTTEFLIFSNG